MLAVTGQAIQYRMYLIYSQDVDHKANKQPTKGYPADASPKKSVISQEGKESCLLYLICVH